MGSGSFRPSLVLVLAICTLVAFKSALRDILYQQRINTSDYVQCEGLICTDKPKVCIA